MGMQIRRDKFVIESGAREADGTKVEPEGQAVSHVFEGSAPVEISTPGVNPMGVAGAVPLQIVAHATAGEVARSVSALCGSCRWWDHVGWLKMLRDNEGPAATMAERHSINSIRAELILNMPDADAHAGSDGEYDVEHAMKSMGLCHALREFYKGRDKKDPGIIGTWPTAGCPAETCTPDRPMGIFEPRDSDARRASAANFDAVMQRAAGKVVGS